MRTKTQSEIIARMASYFGYDFDDAAIAFDKANAEGDVDAWAAEFGIYEAAEYAEYRAGGWSPLGDELRASAAEFGF